VRIACQQPNYFPWAGYFEQIAAADVFIYLNSVQWIRQGRQHRTRLPSTISQPDHNWLTIPVLGHGHRDRAFRELEIDRSQSWAKHHWATLRSLYGRAPFFHSQLEPVVRPFFERAQELRYLQDACRESVQAVCALLGLDAPSICSSDLPETGKKSERLISLCREYSADEYYSALGATRYLDLEAFRAADIRVRWQHFRSLRSDDNLRPVDLSILDWLAHVEKSEIRKTLLQLRALDISNSALNASAHSPLPATDARARSNP
jgi:hypothetical protein